MTLLSLILILMALIVAGCVFYAAWQFSSGEFETRHAAAMAAQQQTKDEPDESKES